MLPFVQWDQMIICDLKETFEFYDRITNNMFEDNFYQKC